MEKNVQNFIRVPVLVSISIVAIASMPALSFASSTNGTVDSSSRYAWSENGGWIDFGVSGGNVQVTDTEISGYAWGESIGWISLNCSNDSSCTTVDYKVLNDSEGNLSGYAWTENIGWIWFAPTDGGVTINSSGEFKGYAWGENIGWIVFNCLTTNTCGTVDYKVATDWLPSSVRPKTVTTSTGGSGGSRRLSPVASTTTVVTIVESVSEAAKSVVDAVESILPDFLKPKPKLVAPTTPPPPEISMKAPSVMKGNWNLLPEKTIGQFVFAPLPHGLQTLAAKFTELDKTFKNLGIEKMSDLEKLRGVTLYLPGLTARAGLSDGSLVLPQGVPLADMSATAKKNIPSEFVFARAAGELVDYSAMASVGDTGNVSEKIAVVSGQQINLVIKPDGPARSVKGYLIFQSAAPKAAVDIPQKSLLAAAVFGLPAVFAEKTNKVVPVEQKLVLQEFKYTDPDGDGIYTADINAPVVAGQYEIFTVIEYVDPDMGTRQVRMTTIVDPEGYVYELNNNKETRIPNVKVSLYRLDPSSGAYEIWPAKDYQQQNPQTTDMSGTYSFLVPVGSYYISIKAPGYGVYKGDPFDVSEGNGVHQNIELHAVGGWLAIIDWKTLVIISIALLLLYTFYRGRRSRGGLLTGFNKRNV